MPTDKNFNAENVRIFIDGEEIAGIVKVEFLTEEEAGERIMRHKIGDKVRLFGTDKKVEITDIEEGVAADMYGTVISAYKINNSDRLYVDIYDGSISEI